MKNTTLIKIGFLVSLTACFGAEQSIRPEQADAIIRKLDGVNTAEAKSRLVHIALDERMHPSDSKYAAAVMARSVSNRTELLPILKSADQEVRETALLGMRGASFSRADWSELIRLLKSGTVDDWRLIALVAASDTGSVPAQERAWWVLEGCENASSLRDATNKFSYGFFYGLKFSKHEIAVHQMLCAFAEMPGLTVSDLTALTPEKKGCVRDWLIALRAHKGDLSLREELHRIMQRDPSLLVRTFATASLQNWGTAADLPVLEEMALTDPAVQERWLRWEDAKPTRTYPVRQQAEELIKRIRARQ